MGLLAQRWAAWSAPALDDEGAWRTTGDGPAWGTAAGSTVTAESAMRVGAVFACVTLLADTVAQLPCHLYERTRAGKERSDDALAWLLHDQPNTEQTAFEFFWQMQAWASVRPAAYAEITWRGARPVSIEPRHPDRIKVERMPDGSRRYAYLQDDGVSWRPILAEDMLRVPGKPVLEYAREAIGFAQAVQRYSSRSFARGVRPSGFIAQDPGTSYTEDARKQLKARILEEHGGSENSGGVLWLPEGLKWNQLGMTNEQAQLVANSTSSVKDIARYFGIAPYRLGVNEPGAMSYASVEMQSVELVVYTLMPWLRRWEQAIGRDLIVDKRRLFAEFLTAALLKGTTAERFAAYAVAIQWGWLSRNDVRRLENLDEMPGLAAYLTPLNMTPSARAHEDGSPAARLASLLASDAATRIVTRETRALPRLLERGDAAAIDAFYAEHVGYVAQALHIPEAAARSYAERQRRVAVDVGSWDTDALVADLVDLAGIELPASSAPEVYSVPSIVISPTIVMDASPIAQAIRETPPVVTIENTVAAPAVRSWSMTSETTGYSAFRET